ncbi:MAG TPA: DMT family transporter [Candidatus Binatia bacterium]|nr:DMT family transporter [Candidatus Binatia bacterium]
MDESNKVGFAGVLLTTLALLAFAGNSILCRLALGAAAIDPASYTALRLVSGALTLRLIGRFLGSRRSPTSARGSWGAGALLFLYAAAFAYAYRSLSAGTGALILFAAVQLTMIGSALRAGEKPSPLEWLGWTVAVAGLVYLVSPGIAAPSLAGSMLMTASGIAWGAYSLLGRGAGDPVQTTTDNFLRSVPLVLLLALVQLPLLTASPVGVIWAVLSGTITSALGYVIWYAVLARLTATQAATLQLSVPVIAAFGGVAFLSEELTARSLIAAVAILGGIGVSMSARTASKNSARIGTPVALKPWSRESQTDVPVHIPAGGSDAAAKAKEPE